MPTVKVRCPKSDCGKLLRLAVKPETTRIKCKCPGCQTAIGITLAVRTKPAEPAAEEGGVYGLAAETSLTYLLRRETDGHKLTPEQKADKKRLIAEGLEANPGQCPACEGDIARNAVLCVACGLNFKTGRRLTTTIEKPAAAAAAAGLAGGIDPDTAGEVLDIAISLIEILGG